MNLDKSWWGGDLRKLTNQTSGIDKSNFDKLESNRQLLFTDPLKRMWWEDISDENIIKYFGSVRWALMLLNEEGTEDALEMMIEKAQTQKWNGIISCILEKVISEVRLKGNNFGKIERRGILIEKDIYPEKKIAVRSIAQREELKTKENISWKFNNNWSPQQEAAIGLCKDAVINIISIQWNFAHVYSPESDQIRGIHRKNFDIDTLETEESSNID